MFFSGAQLDQEGYRTTDLPDLPLPKRARQQPMPPAVAQQIKDLVRRMLSCQPRERPTISEVVSALRGFSHQFPNI